MKRSKIRMIPVSEEVFDAFVNRLGAKGELAAGLVSAYEAIEAMIESASKPKIEVHARRWFQSSVGNTYHSVKVYLDGKLLKHIPFEYGYGEQYLQTAAEALAEAGYYDMGKAYEQFYADRMNDRSRFIVTVQDVTRKKDL